MRAQALVALPVRGHRVVAHAITLAYGADSTHGDLSPRALSVECVLLADARKQPAQPTTHRQSARQASSRLLSIAYPRIAACTQISLRKERFGDLFCSIGDFFGDFFCWWVDGGARPRAVTALSGASSRPGPGARGGRAFAVRLQVRWKGHSYGHSRYPNTK
eukprot:7391244-Prymnesium_polylepis.2